MSIPYLKCVLGAFFGAKCRVFQAQRIFQLIFTGTSDITQKIINDIEHVISIVNAETPKPIKDKPDSESMEKLLAACKIYSMDGVNAAMTEIEMYQYISDDGLVVPPAWSWAFEIAYFPKKSGPN